MKEYLSLELEFEWSLHITKCWKGFFLKDFSCPTSTFPKKRSKEHHHHYQGWKWNGKTKNIHATLTANNKEVHRKKSCRIANLVWWPMISIYMRVKRKKRCTVICSVYLDCDYSHVIGYFHIMEFVLYFSKAIDWIYYLWFGSRIHEK